MRRGGHLSLPGASDMSTTARAIMRTIPLFKNFSDAECDAAQSVMQTRRFATGSVVFSQGSRGDTMVIVLEGHLTVDTTDDEGRRVAIGTIEAGEVVGEMAAVDPGERSATVTAATETLVYELSRSGLKELRQTCPPAASAIVSAIIGDVTRRLRRIDARIELELSPEGVHTPPPPARRAPSAIMAASRGRPRPPPVPAGTPTPPEPTTSVLSRLWARLSGD